MKPYEVVLADVILEPTALPAEADRRGKELQRVMFARAVESDPYFRRTMATPLAEGMTVTLSQLIEMKLTADEANKLREEFLA